MSRFFFLLALLVTGATSAHAEEPASTSTPVAVPAPVVAPDGIMHNRRGLLRNPPAVGVMYDLDGCPVAYTNGAQFVIATDLATMVGATADARVRCIRAKEGAEADHARHQAELAKARAAAGSELLLASAGATAVTTAAGNGEATYVDADRKVAATGNAAPLAAASSGSGYAALGTLAYSQAAWALTRPVVPSTPLTGGGTPSDSAASVQSKKEESPAAATLSEVEARVAAAEARAAALSDAGIE